MKSPPRDAGYPLGAAPGSRRPWRTAARWSVIAALGLLWLGWSGPGRVQELIVNRNLEPLPLHQSDARLYFSLRMVRWPTGVPVTVFVLPDGDELHSAFAKLVLGLFPYQLRSVWDRQVFSGTGQAPITVADETEMLRRVATTPGGIGYVRTVPPNAAVWTVEVR